MLLEVKEIDYILDVKEGFFNKTSKTILSNISFSLNEGEVIGISGESGGGKTTLAKIIAGLIIPTSGEVKLSAEKDVINPVQILFQNTGEIVNPYRRVNDVLAEALKLRNNNINKRDLENGIRELLNSVELNESLRYRKGFELSGGEQQRAALARLLAVKPRLLILDEPFSAQDPVSRMNFLDLFMKINNEFKIAIICISHNLKILKMLCSKVIVIYKGSIAESGNTSEIFDSPKHPYTKYLLSAEDYSLTFEELNYKHD